MNRNRLFFFLFPFLLAATGNSSVAEPPGEYQVKAAFIHNIVRLVSWPSQVAFRNTTRLCILGPDPFGKATDTLAGREISGTLWEIAFVSPNADLSDCQVLFISAEESGNLSRILQGIRRRPILTMADNEGFAARGVMVNFYREDAHVRFEINLDAVRQSGLVMSSQLLKLARIVRGLEAAP